MFFAAAFLVVVLALIAGAVCTVLGVRGRRIDDHPLCARCGFDVAGLGPNGGASPPPTCPECGAGLATRSAVKRGNRVWRRGLVRAGMALLACALILGVPMAATALVGSSLNPYKPTWLLLLEAETRSDRAASGIVAELLTRHGNGSLGSEDQARLVRRALQVQQSGFGGPGWTREWAGVLEDDTFRAMLNRSQRTAAESMDAFPSLAARARVREGQPLPVRLGLSVGPRFLSPGVRSGGCTDLRVRVIDASGQEVAARNHKTGGVLRTYRPPGNTRSAATSYLLSVPLNLPPGAYTLEIRGEVFMTGRAANYPFIPAAGDVPVPVSLDQPLEVVSRETPTATLVVDPELRTQLNEVLQIYLSTSAYSATQAWVGMAMNLAFPGGNPPVPIRSFDDGRLVGVYRATATRVVDGTEDPRTTIPLGSCVIAFQDGTWMMMPSGTAVDGAPQPGTYRVVLTPDPLYAESQVDYDQILAGDLVFEGVILK